MITNWNKFNESVNTNISEEDIMDIFIGIKEDLHYNIEIKYCVLSGAKEWFNFDDYEAEPVYGVGYKVTIPHFHYSISNIEEFTKHKKLIVEIESSCLKLQRIYKVKNIKFEYNDNDICIIIPIEPSKKDVYFISYEYLKDYEREIPLLDGDSSMEFKEENGNFFTIITYSGDKNIDIKDFQDKFNSEFIVYIYGTGKYDSIEKKGNQFIIKNFISIDDIKFKY
jgi:hypothetical protein